MSPLTARRMATPHLARDEARPIANLPELIHKKSRHLEVPFGAGEPKPGTSHNQRPQAADSGIVAMLKVESAPLVSLLLLIATPTIADGIRELDRCELEAERLYPAPLTKGVQDWAEWAANLQKRAENVETCMRAAGYSLTAECSAPLKTYESCIKIADEVMRGPSRSQYHDADWNKICLDNEWDVRTQERLSASCYQPRSWWRRWLDQ